LLQRSVHALNLNPTLLLLLLLLLLLQGFSA
jgi:hypothetical protein